MRGALCGGLRRNETMLLGDAGAGADEGGGAIRSVDGRGLLLGTGCVTPCTRPLATCWPHGE